MKINIIIFSNKHKTFPSYCLYNDLRNKQKVKKFTGHELDWSRNQIL